MPTAPRGISSSTCPDAPDVRRSVFNRMTSDDVPFYTRKSRRCEALLPRSRRPKTMVAVAVALVLLLSGCPGGGDSGGGDPGGGGYNISGGPVAES